MKFRSQYDWDKNKAKTNLKKHGISFEEAITVLQSKMTTVFEDRNHNEKRFVAIGYCAATHLLVVVYCYREEDIVRIISARKATKKERLQYEKGI